MNDPGAIAPRRVAITGLGVVSALGLDVDPFWRSVLAGASGIRRLDFAVEHELPVAVGGTVDDDELARACALDAIRDPDRWNRMGLLAIGRALAAAGHSTNAPDESSAEELRPFDVVVGTGHGNVQFTNAGVQAFERGGYRKLRPTTILRSMFHRLANLATIRFGLGGASHVVSAACASASVAFGDAYQRVRFGLADTAVAAAADSGFDLPTFSAWNRLGVLSKIPEPERASRPFDRARDGLVMGEGAAAFVLEAWDAARARGAPILAEVLGYASRSDARHIVQPDADGQVRALSAALESAGIAPADVDYVNAHGTGTEIADVVEADSLVRVFGPADGGPLISNTKAQLGHLMGATAGVELAATVLALRDGVVPACGNLDDPDPRCPLNFVRDEAREAELSIALKQSFAFGGTNSVVVLGRG